MVWWTGELGLRLLSWNKGLLCQPPGALRQTWGRSRRLEFGTRIPHDFSFIILAAVSKFDLSSARAKIARKVKISEQSSAFFERRIPGKNTVVSDAVCQEFVHEKRLV